MTYNRANIHTFVAESNRIEGIHRAPTKQEIDATLEFVNLPRITLDDLEKLVYVYQRNGHLRDEPGMDVRVGNYIAPPGGPHIKTRLEALLEDVNERRWSPYHIHQQYEHLHPFIDGNGRSGRAIWLWQMGEFPLIGFLHAFYYQTLATQSEPSYLRPEARFGTWILTSERQPEGNDTVLGSGPSTTVEGRYWRDTMSADFVRRNSNFVTHWMPMPDKPLPQKE